jgi:hypothetical protein
MSTTHSTACAGFIGITCPVTSQSKSILIAARCCFTVGFAKAWLLGFMTNGLGLLTQNSPPWSPSSGKQLRYSTYKSGPVEMLDSPVQFT